MILAAFIFDFLSVLGTPPARPSNPSGPPPAGAAPSAPPVEIRDIAPPVDVFPYPLWMIVLAACLAAIVLGFVVYALVRWIRNRPAPPPPSPRAVALQALEALRGQLHAIEPYAFSIAVSDVLRSYVGAEYGLHAPRQTSPEFLASISGSQKFSDADRSLLAGFLERCDLIKFAHIDASVEDSARLLESSVSLVQGSVIKSGA